MYYMLELTDLLAIQPSGGVKWLNDGGGVADEERVARGARQHADNRQPDISRTLRWIATKTDTQHVWQSLKQRPSVLLQTPCVLHTFTSVPVVFGELGLSLKLTR